MATNVPKRVFTLSKTCLTHTVVEYNSCHIAQCYMMGAYSESCMFGERNVFCLAVPLAMGPDPVISIPKAG